tara:strand:- start:778 stop:1080 length:303 start_codon:yes stop_codon:yes gene_type:complete
MNIKKIIAFIVGFWVLNIVYPLIWLFTYDILTGNNTLNAIFVHNPHIFKPEVIFGLYTQYLISVLYNSSKFFGTIMFVVYCVLVFHLFKEIKNSTDEAYY